MPFGDITANTKVYQPRDPGVYSLSTLTFGNPKNEFRIRGASKGKDGSYRGSVTRLIEKDVTINGTVVTKSLVVTLSLTAPVDFTAAEIDTAVSDIDAFITASTLTRLLAGES